ncbi:hypothetical protein CHS0354_019160 [Potamilus streckersoni]|uniref:ZP domain-containing protein n=1 Tax=Potamilus streckersoni TaxID=2493646 RepID=A0AAE0SZW3_9BIVA|nr:hypothetical protein CHS0354_019160 [Potamilus streckersoni]
MDRELNTIFADFFAFCFRDSPYITISCNVKICPKGSQECTVTCYDHYRVRRRDSDDDISLGKVSTNLYIVDAPILVDSAPSFGKDDFL